MLVLSRRGFLVAAAATTLSACSTTMPVMAPGDNSPEALTPESMLRQVNEVRAANGRPAWSWNQQLAEAARSQARLMAAKDKLSHDVGGSFTERLRKGGYHSRAAAENISAGYYTLAEAFSGWRDSPPHRANMLLKGATRMGIAAVYSPGSKYKVFWSLILADPRAPGA